MPRGESLAVGGSSFSSVTNSRWRLYICGNLDFELLHFESARHHICWISDAYRNANTIPKPDELGAVRTIPSDRLTGVAVTEEHQDGKHYIGHSHLPQLAMSDIWSGEPKWPADLDLNGEVTNTDKIVILGGRKNWLHLTEICEKNCR